MVTCTICANYKMVIFIYMYKPYTKWHLVQNVLLQCMADSQDNALNIQFWYCKKG